MHTCEIEQLVCIAKGKQTKRSNSRPHLHHSPVSSGSYGSGAGVRESVRGGVPRRVGRLAGAAWRQPALDAARRARRCRGWGAHEGPVRRRAAESRHCGSAGREIGGYFGDGREFGGRNVGCMCRWRGEGDGWGRKGRGREGRERDRAQTAKGFSASRGNARARTCSGGLASGTAVGGSSKIVCARACACHVI